MSQRQIQFPWVTDVFTTTDATPTVASNATYVTVSGSSGHVEVTVNARNTATGATMSMRVLQPFKNVSGTLTLIGTLATLLAAAGDAGMLTALVTVVSSGTTVQPRVTGIAATNIEWMVDARYFVN